MTDLAPLRARIAALEGLPALAAAAAAPAVTLGVAAIDACLPWGGLPAGGLHEIRAENPAAPGAAVGFASFCLGRMARQRRGPLVWVTQRDGPYPPGLAGLGLPVERLLLVRPAATVDLLWSLEEALRCRAVAGLLGELSGLDPTALRRLSLASRASGVPALLFNSGAPLAALLTRWLVASAPSESRVGVGERRWRLTLARCRGSPMGNDDQVMQWWVEAKDAAGGFGLVPYSLDRPARHIGERRAG